MDALKYRRRMTTFPATATLIEQIKPNAKGEGVVQVHAIGCRHQHRINPDLVTQVADPEREYLHFGKGVDGAVAYQIALRNGMLDDGVVHGPWIARLAPCAKTAQRQ